MTEMTMDKADQKKQISPYYAGDERPVYIEPKIQYPRFGQNSNEGEAEPAYVMGNRRYSEYR